MNFFMIICQSVFLQSWGLTFKAKAGYFRALSKSTLWTKGPSFLAKRSNRKGINVKGQEKRQSFVHFVPLLLPLGQKDQGMVAGKYQASKQSYHFPTDYKLPNFLDVQKNSFKRFLKSGLIQEFQLYKQVSSEDNVVQITFYPEKYRLQPPKLTVKQAIFSRKTYGADLMVPVKISNWDRNQHFFEWFMITTLPLMTNNGHFIINGSPRLVMNQMARSPGVYFKKNVKNHKRTVYTADFIAHRGTWLRLEIDTKKNDIWVRLKNTPKIPFFIFLIGFGVPSSLYQTYFDTIARFAFPASLKQQFPPTPANEPVSKQTSRQYFWLKYMDTDPFKDEQQRRRVVAFDQKSDGFTHTPIPEYMGRLLGELSEETGLLSKDEGMDPLSEAFKPPITSLSWPRPWDIPEKQVPKIFYRKFFNKKSYTLSSFGRAKLNRQLGLNVPLEHTLLTGPDLIRAGCYLIDCMHGKKPFSDIDHLKNRKIKPAGELIQNQWAIGLLRLENHIKERFRLANQENVRLVSFWGNDPGLYRQANRRQPEDPIKRQIWEPVPKVKKPIDVEKLDSHDIRESFANLISTQPVTGALREFFGTNPLSQLLDQTNPLAELTHKRRLSSLGFGGVNRQNAGMDIRGIHPSHYGRVCPIETPEGQNAGLVNSFTIYSALNNQGFIQTPFYESYKGCVLKNKPPVLFTAEQEKEFRIGPGDLYKNKFNFLPKDILLPSRQTKNFQRVDRAAIDHIAIHPTQMISVATSLIPFLEHDDGNRALMGSNMQRQAVPTLKATPPIVGTGLEYKIIAESRHGLQAKKSGMVSYVDGQNICIYSSTLWTKGPMAKSNQRSQRFYKETKDFWTTPSTTNQSGLNLTPGSLFKQQTMSNANNKTKSVFKSAALNFNGDFNRPHNQTNDLDLNQNTTSLNATIGALIKQSRPSSQLGQTWINTDTEVETLATFQFIRPQTKPGLYFSFYEKQLQFLLWQSFQNNSLNLCSIFDLFSQPSFPIYSSFYLNKPGFVTDFISPMIQTRGFCPEILLNYAYGLLNELDTFYSAPRYTRKSLKVNQSDFPFFKTKPFLSTFKRSFPLIDDFRKQPGTKQPLWGFSASSSPLCAFAFASWAKGPRGLRSSSILFLRKAQPNFRCSKRSKNLFVLPNKFSYNLPISTSTTVSPFSRRGISHDLTLASPQLSTTRFYGPLIFNIQQKNSSPNIFFKTIFSFRPRILETKDKETKQTDFPSSGFLNAFFNSTSTKDKFSQTPGTELFFQHNFVKLNSRPMPKGGDQKSDLSPLDTQTKKPRKLLNQIGLKPKQQMTSKQANSTTKKNQQLNALIQTNYTLDSLSRSNQDTYLLQRPIVYPGQWVERGDLLADNSASYKGELSIGQNLLVGYTPWEGYNFEDAVLLSERTLSDELFSSLHVERYEVDIRDTLFGIETITRDLPKFKPTDLSHLDKNGIVKVGTWVEEGEILVGKSTPLDPDNSQYTMYEKLLYDILGEPLPKGRDSSLRVPSHVKGRVIHVDILETIADFSKINFQKEEEKKRKKEQAKLERKAKQEQAKQQKENNQNVNLQKETQLKVSQGLDEPSQLRYLVKHRKGKKNRFLNRKPNSGRFLWVSTSRGLKKQKTGLVMDPGIGLAKKLLTLDSQLANKNWTKPLTPLALTEQKQKKGKGKIWNNLSRRIYELVQKKQADLLHYTKNQYQKQSFSKSTLAVVSAGSGNTKDDKMMQRPLCGPRAARSSWQRSVRSYVHFVPLLLPLGQKDQGPFGMKRLNQKQSKGHNGLKALLKPTSTNQQRTLVDKKIVKKRLSEFENPYALFTKSTHCSLSFITLKSFSSVTKFIYNPVELKPELPELQRPKKVQVYIAEKRLLQIGDKIAGRHGNKGIISNILPPQDMPYLPDGTPLDLVLNPLGVPSRMNVGQIFECLLGLAGSYLHQTYRIQPFDELYGCEASRSLVYSKLYEARLKTQQNWLFDPNFPGKVRLFDGRTGQCFEQPVTVGRAYILKLIHLVDEKIHARSTGPYALVTQQPLRGRAKKGGQRVGEMEVWAFEGFGAAYILHELFTVKSDAVQTRNNLFTTLLKNKPITLGTPESFRVLLRELQALCLDISVYRTGLNGQAIRATND